MRLLWLTEHYPPSGGGMAVSADRIVRNLRRSDVAVDVVHWSSREQRVGSGAGGWSHVEQLGGRLWRCPVGDDPEHALARTWAMLQDAAADTTHVAAFGGVLPLLAGPAVAAGLGVPLVVLLRGNDADTGVFSLRRRAVLSDAVARAARVCAVSRDKVRLVESMWPDVPVTWAPNGIDLAEWEVTAADAERARSWRDATVASGRRVVGMFGHLKAKKGALRCIEALAVSGVAEAWHLLLVGEIGPGVGEAAHRLLEPGAWTHVPFGDRYDLLSWIPACDVVAVPSYYDGMPNVLLEAAACGVPILAAGAGGMADILVDGEHGWMFAASDDEALRRVLVEVASVSDEELARRGKAARSLVEEQFDAGAETRRYLDVLTRT